MVLHDFIVMFLIRIHCNVRMKSGSRGYIQAAVCIVMIAGLYQSYIFTTVTLILFHHLLSLTNGEGWKETVISGCKQVVLIVVGILLYFLLYHTICYFMQIDMDPVKSMSGADQLSFFAQILFVYRKAIRNLVFPYSILPAILVSGSSCILIGITIFKLIQNFWRNGEKNNNGQNKHITEFVLMMCLIIVFPIASIGIALINSYIHELMIYALWFIYCFTLSVFENQTIIQKKEQPKINTKNNLPAFVTALCGIF